MGLTSKAYQDARKSVKNQDYAIKRLKLLFVRILTRIERITIFLREDDIDLKDLKSKISLLSSLLEVKKKIRFELKELDPNTDKSNRDLGELLK